MFCPKCGTEIRNGISFCPKCGVKIQSQTEKSLDVNKKTLDYFNAKDYLLRLKQLISTVKKIPKKMVAGIVAVVVVGLIAVNLLGHPSTKNLDVEELAQEYFENNIVENKDMYRICFDYMMDDLSDRIKANAGLLLKTAGFTPMFTKQRDAQDCADSAMILIKSYFSSDKSSQKELVKAVTQYSSIEIGDMSKENDIVTASVTIQYLDITSVDKAMMENATTLVGFSRIMARAKDLTQEVIRGKAGFIVEAFKDTAENSEERKSSTGIMEFSYDKKRKKWFVNYVDNNLLNAYYGMETR